MAMPMDNESENYVQSGGRRARRGLSEEQDFDPGPTFFEVQKAMDETIQNLRDEVYALKDKLAPLSRIAPTLAEGTKDGQSHPAMLQTAIDQHTQLRELVAEVRDIRQKLVL